MKFLFSVPPKKGMNIPDEMQTNMESGLPVIPSFALGDCNRFIGCNEDEFSNLAKVKDLELDINDFAQKLCSTYAGLPAKMIEDMIVAIATKVDELPLGTEWRVFVTPESATLHEMGQGKDTLVHLWKDLDTKVYL